MVPLLKRSKTGILSGMWCQYFFERLGGSNISIAAGMLDSSKGLKTVEHIFVDDKPDYYEIEDDLPKYPQYYK